MSFELGIISDEVDDDLAAALTHIQGWELPWIELRTVGGRNLMTLGDDEARQRARGERLFLRVDDASTLLDRGGRSALGGQRGGERIEPEPELIERMDVLAIERRDDHAANARAH